MWKQNRKTLTIIKWFCYISILRLSAFILMAIAYHMISQPTCGVKANQKINFGIASIVSHTRGPLKFFVFRYRKYESTIESILKHFWGG